LQHCDQCLSSIAPSSAVRESELSSHTCSAHRGTAGPPPLPQGLLLNMFSRLLLLVLAACFAVSSTGFAIPGMHGISSTRGRVQRRASLFMGRAAAVREKTKTRTDAAKAKNNNRYAKKIIMAVKAGGAGTYAHMHLCTCTHAYMLPNNAYTHPTYAHIHPCTHESMHILHSPVYPYTHTPTHLTPPTHLRTNTYPTYAPTPTPTHLNTHPVHAPAHLTSPTLHLQISR
jgi:hypothetical protein